MQCRRRFVDSRMQLVQKGGLWSSEYGDTEDTYVGLAAKTFRPSSVHQPCTRRASYVSL